MELLIWWFGHCIEFGIASTPLIMYFICKKKFRLSPKSTQLVLVLQLIVSVYFWIKTKDLFLVFYQSVPYVLSFIMVWCDLVALKINTEKEQEHEF